MDLLRDLVAGWLLVFAVLVTTTPTVAQKKGARPGINKPFKNPNVKEFIGKFEREGRDAFDHRKQIVAACGIKPGMVVADIGAGTGLFTRLFASLVGPTGRVYAVDIARNFVKHIEETTRQQGYANVVGVVCDQKSVKLPPRSIDLVFICDVYHHFEFPQRTMRSIHRALRPGGEVILIDFHRIEGVTKAWIMKHVRAGQETFTKEIIAAGFKQVEERKLLRENYFLRFKKAAERESASISEPGRHKNGLFVHKRPLVGERERKACHPKVMQSAENTTVWPRPTIGVGEDTSTPRSRSSLEPLVSTARNEFSTFLVVPANWNIGCSHDGPI